mgnify:CR=1 FL=1|tara:strand:- start:1027 stop:1602 length:576 start_codon:yes stop_codon:yes gene_type:complete
MFNYDPSGTSSFSPSWGASTSYNPSSSVTGGSGGASGGSMFPVGAALGAASSIFSGIMQGQAQRNQTAMEWALGKAQIQAAERAGFQNLLAGQYALTGAKQFEQGLQRDAADYQQAFLDPRKSILTAEDFNRRAATELGQFGKQLSQQQNIAQINQTAAEKRLLTDAMFGEVARKPFSYGVAPGYTTGSLV